jgi:hypothetical protein
MTMKNSLRTFALVAVAGLGVLALAQTPVQAQFRRAMPHRPVPVAPVAPVFPTVTPRAMVTVPPVRSFTNPYVLPGMTLNQLATLSTISMDPTLMTQLLLYNNSRRPIIVTPPYSILPYTMPTATYPYTLGTVPYSLGTVPYSVGTVGFPYSSYYNPYFGAYGLYP